MKKISREEFKAKMYNEELDRLRVNCYRMIFKEIERRNLSIESVTLLGSSKEDILKEYNLYINETDKIS